MRDKHPFPFDTQARDVTNAFMRTVGEKFRLAQEGYVSSHNVQIFSHGGNWQSHHSYDPDRVDEVKTHHHEMTFDINEIVIGRLDYIEQSVAEIVGGMVNSFAQSFYQVISDTCEEHGNVVQESGTLAEQFLRALEGIELSVDRDGNVNLPELRVGSGMAERIRNDASLHSPEHQAKADAITRLKSVKALEREAARKAKFRKGEA